jgi:hypothetical protein
MPEAVPPSRLLFRPGNREFRQIAEGQVGEGRSVRAPSDRSRDLPDGSVFLSPERFQGKTLKIHRISRGPGSGMDIDGFTCCFAAKEGIF